MSKNKPTTLTTGRRRRNVVIVCIVVAAAIIAAVFFLVPTFKEVSQVQAVLPTPIVEEPQVQENVANYNTPEEAEKFISKYYQAIASRDAATLKAMGQYDAATAIERGWLDTIGYAIDINKLANPTVKSFPKSEGLYAGCSLYRIVDFYEQIPVDALKTDIHGMRTAEGWVYYDAVNVKWNIADPLIPTAIAAPESGTVEKSSMDGKATATLKSTGAFSNPWWSYSKVDIQVKNRSENTPVSIKSRTLDKGVSINLTGDITQGGGTILPNTEKTGSCQVLRGTLYEFPITKIGDYPLSLNGDITPVEIIYGTEQIQPILTIGQNMTIDKAYTDIVQQQIKDHNANTSNSNAANDNTNQH